MKLIFDAKKVKNNPKSLFLRLLGLFLVSKNSKN